MSTPVRARVAAVLGALLTVVTLACAPATSAGPSNASPRDPKLLTAAEIRASAVADGTLIEAIRTLRPAFLVPRGTADRRDVMPTVEVAIDNGSPGPLSLIEEVRARGVASVRLLTSEEANQRFGMRDVYGPVLLIATR